MDELPGKIFNAATGVWALVCMAAVALFKAWPNIMGRLNERRRDRAAEEASDWERLRSERNVAFADRDHWHGRYLQSEAEKAEVMKENAELKGILQGMGEWRQIQAVREAAMRLAKPGNNNES